MGGIHDGDAIGERLSSAHGCEAGNRVGKLGRDARNAETKDFPSRMMNPREHACESTGAAVI